MNLKAFNVFIKEFYSISALSENEQKEYFLITKYEKKVSKRLLNRKEELLKEGEVKFTKLLTEMINAPNPLLKMIKKDNSYGNLYHYPVILKKGEHFE